VTSGRGGAGAKDATVTVPPKHSSYRRTNDRTNVRTNDSPNERTNDKRRQCRIT
jgi:hypothetical protein